MENRPFGKNDMLSNKTINIEIQHNLIGIKTGRV